VLLATIAAAALTLSTVGTAVADTTTTDDPVQAAAGWLATGLVDGERLEGDFGPDVGLTADAVFALAGAGVAAEQLAAASAWLATQVAGYTQGQPFDAPDAVYAGATAKLVLALLADGRDVTDVGGVDLVAQLQDREQPASADDPGRFTDRSDYGDFSSTLTQSLAVLALARADGASPSDAAVGFTLAQQCPDGGFRFDPDEAGCTSSADTTGFAVQALLAHGSADAVAAAHDGVRWLLASQAADGGVDANANATGLAAVAFALTGDEVAGATAGRDAARSFLLDLQLGCDSDAPGAIAFAADDRGDLARATAQALPGLTGVGIAGASTAGASSDVPSFDCGTAPPAPEPGDGDDADGDDDGATDEPDDVDGGATDDPGTDDGDRPVGSDGDGTSAGAAPGRGDAGDPDAATQEEGAASTIDGPRPTGVPSGLGGTAPAGPGWLVVLLALGAAVAVVGVPALRRGGAEVRTGARR
jgi:hypothetical protein